MWFLRLPGVLWTRAPADSRIEASSYLVVVLPLLPVIASHCTLDVASLLEIEDEDWNPVLHAVMKRLGVHHLKLLLQNILVADIGVSNSVWILYRVF